MGKIIDRQEALRIAQKALTPSIDDLSIFDGLPSWGTVYRRDNGKDEDYWTVCVPNPGRIGAVHTIVISKKTGRVIHNGNLGE